MVLVAPMILQYIVWLVTFAIEVKLDPSFFNSGMGILEGQSVDSSFTEFKSKFWTVYKVNYMFFLMFSLYTESQ